MNPSPTCRHLHTDGRPCGSPALRGEPFCFHHHTARKPMPRRVDPTDPRILLSPQLPAPDDFPAIQRAVGEVLRLLANDRLPEPRAALLLKGLAIASQNLARQHRREEKLAALNLLPLPVTAFLNHPQHGTIALDPLNPNETPLATDNSQLPTHPLPDPIPVFTPDPSPTTSYDEAKTIEINHYFQTVDDKRRAHAEAHLAQREAQLEHELEARYDDRLRETQRDLHARFQAQLQTEVQTLLEARLLPIPIPIPIQQNQDLAAEYENNLALAS